MQAILAEIRDGRRAGNVAVACMGGVGRSGTVAACALLEAGMTPDAAIATVRAVRHPTAVETVAQERFVRSFAAATQATERR
jgi:protein-tyrosine phosphatase